MRALLLELRPASLEHLTINEGLEELAAAYSTRLGIVVTTEISPCHVSPEQTHALLCIAREALSNAIRHADATWITLRLTEENELLFFTVTNNGKGFTLNRAETRHGLGLRTMQERVQELGGTWSVESTPGHGTQVQVSLPQQGVSGDRL
jgi:NarL family two-component system sensor histidine kinase LiaS